MSKRKSAGAVCALAAAWLLASGCSGAGSAKGGTASAKGGRAPKYVFLFIGDGMSFPQFQSAADYLGAMADGDYMMALPSVKDNKGAVLDGPVPLNFMNFEAVGSVVTYDS